MPFMGAVTVDDFASGHAAALAGGTTMCGCIGARSGAQRVAAALWWAVDSHSPRPWSLLCRHIDFVLPVEHDLLAGFRTWEAKAQRGCMDYGACRCSLPCDVAPC
jgi:dihydropyrimidinase